jgi:IQ domain-containing protein D
LEEKAQLDELQARYNELQKEYDRIMEERRVAQELKKEQEKQMRRMVDAATLIQAVFRGWRVRKEIAKKNSKQKKK